MPININANEAAQLEAARRAIQMRREVQEQHAMRVNAVRDDLPVRPPARPRAIPAQLPIAPIRPNDIGDFVFRGRDPHEIRWLRDPFFVPNLDPVEPQPNPDMLNAKEENGPELWRKLLDAVYDIFDAKAVVAGGAVRDHQLGYEPKDIDIFVNVDDASIKELHPELGWGNGVQKDDQMGLYAAAQRGQPIKGVYDFIAFGHRLQLISSPLDDFSGDKIIDRFDFGACMCYYDGREVFVHEHAKRDHDNKTFTLVNTVDRTKSGERFKSFKERHPEWKMVG